MLVERIRRGSVDVAFRGGLADVPGTLQVPRCAVAEGKIRISRLGGYVHFELIDPPADDGAAWPVFNWTMRTKIA